MYDKILLLHSAVAIIRKKKMTELTDQLDKIIQKAALDGALTQDAVSQFHALVKERDALKEANEEWEVSDKKLKKDLARDQAQVKILSAECETWAGREQDLLDREGKCTELEIRKECADSRVTDHQEMFRIVFRNAIIRKEVMTTNENHTDMNGAQHSSFSTKEPVEEEET